MLNKKTFEWLPLYSAKARLNFLLVARYFLLVARYFLLIASYFLLVARYFFVQITAK